MKVEAKLKDMGLALPAELKMPPGVRVTWRQIRVVGTRAIIAGHGPRLTDGTPGVEGITFEGPGRKVGRDLTVEQGYAAARSVGLSVLADLKRELGDLDRVTAWLRVLGMVNSAPGFALQAMVIDGFTDLMVALYGEESAICPRAAAGMSEMPFNSPIIIEGEVEIRL